MLLGKKSQAAPKCLRAALIGLLAVLYIIGNVQLESIHQAFHSLETALHSSEQEQDPCHRAVYHEAINDGCDHSTHFTAVKNCPLCHVVPVNEQLTINSGILKLVATAYIFDEQAISFFTSDELNHLPSRAPPL